MQSCSTIPPDCGVAETHSLQSPSTAVELADRDAGLSGLRVLCEVGQTFLHNAIKVNLRLAGKDALEFGHIDMESNFGRLGQLSSHGGDSFGETHFIELKRAEVLGDGANFAKGLRRHLGNVRDLFAHFRRFLRTTQGHDRAIFDDQKILAQAIVQLGGQALSFLLLGFDEPA